MEDNYAAILIRTNRKPLDVDEVDSRFPDENEIVVKNVAVSVNPIDTAMQDGYVTNMTLPGILGADVAGEVVEVGSQVNRFSIGDRVMGHALRLATDDDRHAGFQNYTVLWENMATPIPPNLSYENASTLPLGISTAAAALFQEDWLNLAPPVAYPPARDEWVIIAGATGNVGSHGVRLAVAAGYKVLGTASTSGFEDVRKLGAAEVVNSREKELANILVERLAGKKVVGAFDATANEDSILNIADAVNRSDCDKKFITSVSDDFPSKKLPAGFEVRLVFAIAIRDTEVSKQVWEDYLPDALATGKYYLPYPRAKVYGNGLDKIQDAMDRKGPNAKVESGEKLVITLQ